MVGTRVAPRHGASHTRPAGKPRQGAPSRQGYPGPSRLERQAHRRPRVPAPRPTARVGRSRRPPGLGDRQTPEEPAHIRARCQRPRRGRAWEARRGTDSPSAAVSHPQTRPRPAAAILTAPPRDHSGTRSLALGCARLPPTHTPGFHRLGALQSFPFAALRRAKKAYPQSSGAIFFPYFLVAWNLFTMEDAVSPPPRMQLLLAFFVSFFEKQRERQT